MQLVAIPYNKIPVMRGLHYDNYVNDLMLSKHSTSFKKMFGEEYYEGWNSGSQCTSHAYLQYAKDVYKYYDDHILSRLYRMNPIRDEEYITLSIYRRKKGTLDRTYIIYREAMQCLEEKDLTMVECLLSDKDFEYVIAKKADLKWVVWKVKKKLKE